MKTYCPATLHANKTMTGTDLLRGKIIAAGYHFNEFSRIIGLSYPAFARRMKTKKFGCDEIEKIVSVLHLTADEALAIFF